MEVAASELGTELKNALLAGSGIFTGTTLVVSLNFLFVVELAGGKTYGILVTATSEDGRQTSVGSRSFHSPASALTATTTSSLPSTALTKYYYMVLFGLLITGFVVLCCNCHGSKGR